jgi:predicted metal-dependent peptidase
VTRPAPTTRDYSHRGTRAVQKMVEYAPATGGLALWCRHRDVDDLPTLVTQEPWQQRPMDQRVREAKAGLSPSALAAANDGATIYYTPIFETLTLPQQIGIVAHQVLHIALRHPQRFEALRQVLGDVDHRLYNTCADAIINSTLSHLGWLELPTRAVLLEHLLANVLNRQQSAAAALLEWDLERLYRTIDDRRREARWGRRAEDSRRRGKGAQQAPQRPQDGEDMSRNDGVRASRVRAMGVETPQDLLPAAGDTRPEKEAEQAREWRERLIRGHAGDGLHSMLRQLIADLPKVRTPWEHLLRTLLTRGLSRSPDLSWSRPARSWLANQGRAPNGRRLPWEPGITASRAVARLVVMVDVSGSVEDDLMARFAREIEAISRRTEAGLTIIIGDAQVTGVEHFEPGRSNLRDIAFIGGGGTKFGPLLREADRFHPDMGVFLTDLDGPTDYRPAWPVLWAVPAVGAHIAQPFGRKLVLELTGSGID